MADTNKVASAEPVAWDGRGKCDCFDDTGLCPRCFPDYPTEPPAQPPAREDAQPYGWIYEKQDFGPGWCAGLEWYPAKFTRTPPNPETSRNVIALYTHSTPDALREALSRAVRSYDGIPPRHRPAWFDQAIAALQAEQKGGA